MDLFAKRTLSLGSAVGLVVLATGIYMKSSESHVVKPVAMDGAARSETAHAIREVDFGFVELHHGKPGAVQSFKYGKPMVLYSGEELEFRALSDYPIPPLELRAGDQVQLLPEVTGKVTIAGPLGQPLPVTLTAQGERVSLPGGAPPRISVKVQVTGPARPK
jgi:hypothetical protein